MIDLNQELENFDAYFFKRHGELPLDPSSEEYANKSYLKHEMFKAWKARAKAQAVPTWIPTSTMLPDDGEEVLFLDSHNVIHEGSLNTDYVDGPYGENNEDHGDYQTLWTSNSNGEEFLLEEIKFWMARPSDPITCGSGAANE
ncbi:hypothetical protein [Acinetobacter baumannii]|uniref:hypothetical protein n=1 Tax=Acinetobacter baumannii TaxID=470 RepID=UPI0024DE46BC|nr:hypothetical protein [Acinetobacter baumannii]MDK2146327.1 hypothetical protein [Acinetobacter baumannii]MDK2164839.1 hypothetical protein [Acinetobacter baumannii]MDK2175888.1 hypothetical protein [Acinetobacter baumannii]MDK2204911.1 hypothetical protein [Acinetobacter baumannii]MDK2211959.1 hypothetical protein [Acinetobacter baumannii]